jgi:hypothetical protein
MELSAGNTNARVGYQVVLVKENLIRTSAASSSGKQSRYFRVFWYLSEFSKAHCISKFYIFIFRKKIMHEKYIFIFSKAPFQVSLMQKQFSLHFAFFSIPLDYMISTGKRIKWPQGEPSIDVRIQETAFFVWAQWCFVDKEESIQLSVRCCAS